MAVHRLSQRVRFTMLIAVAALFVNAVPSLASFCTVADHIRSANTNTAVGFCPAGTNHDIITIADDITLTKPLPPIAGTITIEGGGHTISGNKEFRIFDIKSGNVVLKRITLRNSADLIVYDTNFRNNIARMGGAVAAIDPATFISSKAASSTTKRAERAAPSGGTRPAATSTILNSAAILPATSQALSMTITSRTWTAAPAHALSTPKYTHCRTVRDRDTIEGQYVPIV